MTINKGELVIIHIPDPINWYLLKGKRHAVVVIILRRLSRL